MKERRINTSSLNNNLIGGWQPQNGLSSIFENAFNGFEFPFFDHNSQNYPRYNIYQYVDIDSKDIDSNKDESFNTLKYKIEIALAGFSKDQISVTEKNVNGNRPSIKIITIKNTYMKKPEGNDMFYSGWKEIHKGISQKSFELQFAVGGSDIVEDVSFNDGILSITIENYKNNTSEEAKQITIN